jgi:hypothetical protein
MCGKVLERVFIVDTEASFWNIADKSYVRSEYCEVLTRNKGVIND